jgi:hypothetical protein
MPTYQALQGDGSIVAHLLHNTAKSPISPIKKALIARATRAYSLSNIQQRNYFFLPKTAATMADPINTPNPAIAR